MSPSRGVEVRVWSSAGPAGRPPSVGLPTPHGRAPRLLDQVRERVRALHFSLRTQEAYVCALVPAFVRFHRLRHPPEMAGPEVEIFLTHLAVERGLSVSSQVGPNRSAFS